MVTDGRDCITPILRASLAAGMTTRRLQASCPHGLQVLTQSSTDNDVRLWGLPASGIGHCFRRRLRSAEVDTCLTPRTHRPGSDSASMSPDAGPRLWDSLSTFLRRSDTELAELSDC